LICQVKILFNRKGNKNYDEIMDSIIYSKPDIISFQECETRRISNNFDNFNRYISDRLNYTYYSYGPNPTIGIIIFFMKKKKGIKFLLKKKGIKF
jgi:hypothetical protein